MSNSEPDDCGAAGGGEAVEAGAESNRLMMSAAAFRGGAGAEGEVEVDAGVSELEPKISAKRSCVDGPDDEPFVAGADEVSSPIRSMIESLSVLVEPTGLRSLTGIDQLDVTIVKFHEAYQFPSLSPGSRAAAYVPAHRP